MFARVVAHVAALAQGGEIARAVVAGIVVQMRACQHHAGDAQRGRRANPREPRRTAGKFGRCSEPAHCATAPVAPALTSAEREVLSYLHLGYSNAQIAHARGNTERTVRNQLSSAYAKLGVGSRAEAVAVLAELGVRARHGLG